MRWLPALLAAASLSCADGTGPGAGSIEACEPLTELPPLAAADCRASADARAFDERLREATKDDSGISVVRATLGADARVQSLCADRTRTMGEWKVRQALGARLPELRELPAGPACLAGTRVDLNRRAATLAEADRVEYRCRDEVRLIAQAQGAIGTARALADQLRECIEYHSDWILVYRPGVMQPAVFGRPQVVGEPTVRARDTASRCRREKNRDDEITCVEAEGWELLE